MPITTLSSREFNQDASRAKKAAANGPVFITDRGQPRHVLLSIEDYRRLTGDRRCAALHVPDPRAERDALIAATALVHGMAVATRNTADFAATGVALIDPWAAAAT